MVWYLDFGAYLEIRSIRLIRSIKTMFHNRRGFTLIELLVVFTISAIFFGTGVAAFGRFNRDKNLEKHATAIQEQLEIGKVKARSNDKGGCTTLGHYSVTVDSAYKVTTTAVCATGVSSFSQSHLMVSEENLMIDTASSTDVFTFYHLRPTSDAGCIVLQDQRTNQCRAVRVSSSGVTEIVKSCSCN